MSRGWLVVVATILTLMTWVISAVKLWQERAALSRRQLIRTVIADLLIALLYHWFIYGSDVVMAQVLYPGKIILKHSHEESMLAAFQFGGTGLLYLVYFMWNTYALRRDRIR